MDGFGIKTVLLNNNTIITISLTYDVLTATFFWAYRQQDITKKVSVFVIFRCFV